MTMTRRRLLDDTFKKSVVGNPAIATDSLARMYPGIEMKGWTEQDGTPTPEAPVPIVSAVEYGHVEVEVLGGNSVDESTFNFNSSYWNYENGVFETERGSSTYIYKEITLCPGYYTFSADCISINGTGKIQVRKGSEILYSRTFKDTGRKSISFEAKEGILYRILVGDNDNGAMSFMNIMLNPGTTPLPYEPYKLPQTVTLTADRPLTKWDKLEKRNGQWGWVYKSEEIESYTDESVPGEYFSTTGQLSTGAQVWYETTTETFVPLTTTEQEAMEALHTYRPTTVLSNDAGCEMSLTYKTRKSMEVTA